MTLLKNEFYIPQYQQMKQNKCKAALIIQPNFLKLLIKMSFSMTKPFNRLHSTLEHVQSALNIKHMFNLRQTRKSPKPLLYVSACT